ncbi:MAG: electron transfer flavoprotein subunit beta/FixA family protein, partial [Thermoprotei archaeon]
MSRIAVLIKMVPDVSQMKFDQQTKRLVREGVRNYMNPFDRKAVEEALRLRERLGMKVFVATMGPPSAEETLRDALAMGADEAYLLTDRAFAGADTLATATALSAFLKKIGDASLILGGAYSIDAETGQLMPQIAEQLGYSLATNVGKIVVSDDGRTLSVERGDEDGLEVLELSVPAVLTVSEKINKARTPSPADRERAGRMAVNKVSASDISQDQSLFGAQGSPTTVESVYDASESRSPVIFRFDGSADVFEKVFQA